MSQFGALTIKHKLENDYGTSVESVEETDTDGKWKVEVSIEGGYSFAFHPTDRLRLEHLVGDGNGESLTMYVVEKR